MLPHALLRAAQANPMLVELKNGETFNGTLVNCDTWMNINLRDVICTSREGDRFWRLNECYIRGPMIKYLRIPEEVIEQVKEEVKQQNVRQQKRYGKRPVGSGQRDQLGPSQNKQYHHRN